MAASTPKRTGFVICIKNDGYEASLERRKIYEVRADADAEAHQQIRVVDESGEDYVLLDLPRQTERAVIDAA